MTWYDLSSFVDHREHLLEEAFGALTPDELNILTPVELQHIPLEELKALCLQQLQRMPRARLLAVLQDPLVKLWTANSRGDSGSQPSSLQGILSERAQRSTSIEQEYRDISTLCTTAQMEILELELRARAIRSLMSAKARDATSSSLNAASSGPAVRGDPR